MVYAKHPDCPNHYDFPSVKDEPPHVHRACDRCLLLYILDRIEPRFPTGFGALKTFMEGIGPEDDRAKASIP